MSHKLLTDHRLFQFILKIDADTVTAAAGQGCAHCGAPMDRADYPRKPRGLPAEMESAFARRPSFSCRADGCRRRRTPRLLAFLDRRVYVATVVVLAAAMRQGPSPARLSELKRILGVSRRTVARWLAWWAVVFPQTQQWRRASGAIVPSFDETKLPLSLLSRLDAMKVDDFGGLPAMLRLMMG